MRRVSSCVSRRTLRMSQGVDPDAPRGASSSRVFLLEQAWLWGYRIPCVDPVRSRFVSVAVDNAAIDRERDVNVGGSGAAPATAVIGRGWHTPFDGRHLR